MTKATKNTAKEVAVKTTTTTLHDLNETTGPQVQTEFEQYMKDHLHIDLIGDGITRNRDNTGAFGYVQPKGKGQVTSGEMMSGINLAFHTWAGARGYNNVFLTKDQIEDHLADLEMKKALRSLMEALSGSAK